MDRDTKTQNKIPTKVNKQFYMASTCYNNDVDLRVSLYSSFKELLMAIIGYISENDILDAPMVKKHYQLTKEYDESVMLDVHLIKSCEDYNWEECKKYFSSCFSLEFGGHLTIILHFDHERIDTYPFVCKEFRINTFSEMIFTFGTFPIKKKVPLIPLCEYTLFLGDQKVIKCGKRSIDEYPICNTHRCTCLGKELLAEYQDPPVVVESSVVWMIDVIQDTDGKYIVRIDKQNLFHHFLLLPPSLNQNIPRKTILYIKHPKLEFFQATEEIRHLIVI